MPSASTITEILRRHGRLEEPARAARDGVRFERPEPNDLWQMDFKGHFALRPSGARCRPLTVLDDQPRSAVGLRALPHEQGTRVRAEREDLFRRYGVPRALLTDTGSP